MLEATELFSRGVGCAVAETQLKGHGGRSPIHKRGAGDGLNDRQPARNIDGEALAARRFFLSTIKIVLSLAVVALASAMTYGAARHSFAAADLVGISILALTVNVILLATAARLIRSRIIANAVMAGIVIAGLLTMHIVHTDIYRGPMATLLVLSCAAYAAVFVGLHAVDDHPWAGVMLAVMALVGIGTALFRPHFERLLALTIDQREIQEITFEQRPNVYLVGFDGMTPAALLERFDVESTPFHDLMSSRFRVFHNFFTSNVMTMWAFNSLLALDENILNRYSRAIPYLRLFAGTHDAPLFRLFRSNGYEITTLYGDHYFGSRGGPYIDNYITITPEVVCGQLDVAVRDFSFYGYCTIGTRLAELLGVGSVGSMDVGSSASDDQRVVEHILQRSRLERPQLVLAHIYRPGHAGWHFDMHNQDDMAAFSARYIADVGHAAELLTQILDHLEAHDPNAILFVFGDHGPTLARGMDPSDDMPFFITDHYATVGGVFPPHRCSKYLGLPANRAANYMTTLDAMHGILRCLSGGQSAMNVERDDRMIVQYDLRYEDFLYE